MPNVVMTTVENYSDMKKSADEKYVEKLGAKYRIREWIN